MRVTARVDYAVRALVQLASDASVEPVKAEQLATAQQIPLKFLLEILRQLKQHKLLVSRRGPEGGYTLGQAGRRDRDRGRHPRGRGTAGHRPRHQPRVPRVRRARPSRCGPSGSRSGAACGTCSRTSPSQDVLTGKLPKHVVAIAEKYGVDERP